MILPYSRAIVNIRRLSHRPTSLSVAKRGTKAQITAPIPVSLIGSHVDEKAV